MRNDSFISRRLFIIIRDSNALDESRCKSKTYSYLVNFKACFFVKLKKTILTYTGSELENKRINCEKGGFRAIHTENDADMFISWRRMINGATEYSRGPISEIFLASTALS